MQITDIDYKQTLSDIDFIINYEINSLGLKGDTLSCYHQSWNKKKRDFKDLYLLTSKNHQKWIANTDLIELLKDLENGMNSYRVAIEASMCDK